ncbi:hypothetical protein AB6D20_006940 [Vibrio splendidus]
MKEKKIEFLYQSIADTQATIRALDVKLGFFFVIIFLPFAATKEIINVYQALSKIEILSCIANLVGIIWLISFVCLFLATVSKDNPSKALDAELSEGNKNAFYNGDVISANICSLIPRFTANQKATFTDKLEGLPNSENALIITLTFEAMKLAYIRDVKIIRSNACMYSTFLWIGIGAFLWVNHLLTLGVSNG